MMTRSLVSRKSEITVADRTEISEAYILWTAFHPSDRTFDLAHLYDTNNDTKVKSVLNAVSAANTIRDGSVPQLVRQQRREFAHIQFDGIVREYSRLEVECTGGPELCSPIRRSFELS